MKRRDYRLDQMMRGTEAQTFMEMFLDDWEFDEETNAWIPSPVAEYTLQNYWEVQNAN